jgi:hypothetical protein
VCWTLATVFGITLSVFETGSDPTQIPFAAFFAPAAAALLTALAGVIANVFRRGLGGRVARPPAAGQGRVWSVTKRRTMVRTRGASSPNSSMLVP